MFSINTINYRMNNVGTPTIKGEIRKARASGYNFTKAMGDIMDGAITMDGGSVVYITINPDTRDPDKISSITVSDNIETGMASLKYTGSKHPLCWTCDSDDHGEDSAISEFGTGLKAAAVNIGSKMVITTKYYDDVGKLHLQNIDCNWEKMIKDNTYEPNHIQEISENEYNRLHKDPNGTPLNSGTTIEISEISDKFTGRTKNSVDELRTYIANTYHTVSRRIYVDNKLVNINVPCTHISNYAHDIHSIDVEIYEDDIIIKPMISTGDITDYSNKKIRKVEYDNTKHEFTTVAIKDGEYNAICRIQDKKDTCSFKGTRQYGMGEKIPHKMKTWTLYNLPQGGSVNISRNGRMLTNWSKDNPRHISFGPKFHMEQHYNYFHMNYNSKQTGALLGISYTKSIDGNFPKNKLFMALSYSHTELKKHLGTASKFLTEWENKHKIPWNREFSPLINLNMAIYYKQWLMLAGMVYARYKKHVIQFNEGGTKSTTTKVVTIDDTDDEDSGDTKSTTTTVVTVNDVDDENSGDTKSTNTTLVTVNHVDDENSGEDSGDTKSTTTTVVTVNHVDDENSGDTGRIPGIQHDDITTTSMCVYGEQNYLGIFGCDETGISCTKDGICKGKFGFTTQMAKKREGGGDYPSERFQIISVDHVTINCEPQLLQQIGLINEVIFYTKERFTFPIEKLGEIKKVYNSIVSDNFRTPTLLVD